MNKKYWLWGGIIGGLLMLIPTPITGDNSVFFPLVHWVSYLMGKTILLPFYSMCGTESGCYGVFGINVMLAYFVSGFIIGAFLGWLYGKIKNRNNKVI